MLSVVRINDFENSMMTRYDGFCVLFVFIKLALTSIMLSLVTKQQIEVNNYFMRIVFVVFSFYYQVSVLINSVTHLNFHMTPWHIYISSKWKFGHLDPCLELSLLLSTFTNISVWVCYVVWSHKAVFCSNVIFIMKENK